MEYKTVQSMLEYMNQIFDTGLDTTQHYSSTHINYLNGGLYGTSVPGSPGVKIHSLSLVPKEVSIWISCDFAEKNILKLYK